jgi:hypothetical protein
VNVGKGIRVGGIGGGIVSDGDGGANGGIVSAGVGTAGVAVHAEKIKLRSRKKSSLFLIFPQGVFKLCPGILIMILQGCRA